MVAPTAFTFNEQAAQDNHFMHAINSGGQASPATDQLYPCNAQRYRECHATTVQLMQVQSHRPLLTRACTTAYEVDMLLARCPDAGHNILVAPVPQNSNVLRRVLSEFAGLYQTLTEAAGVNVNLFQHSVAHNTPDACFPNNWCTESPSLFAKRKSLDEYHIPYII